MMSLQTLATCVVTVLCLLHYVASLSLPLLGEQQLHDEPRDIDSVQPEHAGRIDLVSDAKLESHVKVTLGGKDFDLRVDTKSSGIWVAGDVPQDNTTGQVDVAVLNIGTHRIAGQTFVHLDADSRHRDGSGILGLGPTGFFSTGITADSPSGRSPQDRLSTPGMTAPRYVTMLFGRASASASNGVGSLTVAELLSGYEDVTQMPRLRTQDGTQQWTIQLDEGGIIGPNGEAIQSSMGTQLTAIIDSESCLSRLPRSVAEAIYSRVPGARIAMIPSVPEPVWVLPCHTELNVAFRFGKVSYPVHPADVVTTELLGPPDASGKPSCVGAFQPMSANGSSDIVLGTSFLRNTYTLLKFGDRVAGGDSDTREPFVQLLPITDPAQAHVEFIQIRLSNIGSSSSFRRVHAKRDTSDATRRNVPWIVAGSIIGANVLGWAVFAVIHFTRRRRYQQLHDPAPEGLREFAPSSKSLDDSTFGSSRTSESSLRTLRNPSERASYKQAVQRKATAGDLMPIRRELSLISTRRRSFEEPSPVIDIDIPPLPAPPVVASSKEILPPPRILHEPSQKPLPLPKLSVPTDRLVPNPFEDEPMSAILLTPSSSMPTPYTPYPLSPARADSPEPFNFLVGPATAKRRDSSRSQRHSQMRRHISQRARESAFELSRGSRNSTLYPIADANVSSSSLAATSRSGGRSSRSLRTERSQTRRYAHP